MLSNMFDTSHSLMNEEQHIMKNMSNQSSHSLVKMNAPPNNRQENVCAITLIEQVLIA